MKWWNTYKILAHKRKQLRSSSEEIHRYQSWKLHKLVTFAYNNSPFYRKNYERWGVHPDQIRTEEDLKRLPILEKTTLRQTNPLDLITVRRKNGLPIERDLIEDATSGSTGEPLKIIRTWQDLSYTKANDIRAFQQTGFRFYHRQVILKSSSESLTGKHWFEKFGILRKYWLSITDSPEENLKKLKQIRSHHLHGYPNGLLTIAELLQAKRQTFHIPIICTGAEVRRGYGSANAQTDRQIF